MTSTPTPLNMREEEIARFVLPGGRITIVDTKDAHLLEYKWCYKHDFKGGGYAARSMRVNGKTRSVKLHHAIIGRSLNRKLQVDHINGDPLDNRRSNLRFVTPRMNGQNKSDRRGKKCSSQYLGVSRDKHGRKWTANICIKGKRMHLGTFQDEADAATVYLLSIPPEDLVTPKPGEGK